MPNLILSVRRAPVLLKSVANRPLDAFESLEVDHMKVETLFLQLRLLRSPSTRAKLFARIKAELELHSQLEESVVYPSLAKEPELEELVREAREEHAQFKRILGEVPDLTRQNLTGQAKLKVLMEDVNHHVAEEENKLFPRARKYLSPNRIELLGREMRAFRAEHGKSSGATQAVVEELAKLRRKAATAIVEATRTKPSAHKKAKTKSRTA